MTNIDAASAPTTLSDLIGRTLPHEADEAYQRLRRKVRSRVLVRPVEPEDVARWEGEGGAS